MARPTLGEHVKVAQGHVRSRVVDAIVHAFTRVRYKFPDSSEAKNGVRVLHDVAYGPDPSHRLDVYAPVRAARPLPTVLYVHGGGFAMLSKRTHRVMAMAIARRGYLVFNIDYRLGVLHQYPTPLEDACRALLWVAEHGRRFGADPQRLALAGESAGGNLVTALAIAHATRRPEPFARRVFDAELPLRAVISTYPFLDVHDVHRFREHPRAKGWVKDMMLDASTSYVGSRVFGPPDPSALYSPITALEGLEAPDRPLPPFFVSVGTRDPLLPQSERLKAALDRLGVPCTLHISPGQVHGYDALIWRAPAQEKWRAAHAFLAEHMAPRGA